MAESGWIWVVAEKHRSQGVGGFAFIGDGQRDISNCREEGREREPRVRRDKRCGCLHH